jgi:hypothetical protein|tara:strand:+ start:909 stop:1397 length:489 start_codon:yes stop_codon:yes gene_type:complete
MAFKMKGSPIKLGKIQGTSSHTSALKQTYVENVPEGSGMVNLDGTDYHKGEGLTIIPWSEEAEAAHKANERRLFSLPPGTMTADEMNAELAKTRHLVNPNPEEVIEEPTVYPKNPKEPRGKKQKRRGKMKKVRRPKSKKTKNLVTGGWNVTSGRTGRTRHKW